MTRFLIEVLVVGVFVSAIATLASADEAKDRAIEQDRMKIKGTWRVISLEINGNKAMAEDVTKLTVVNGSDGTWSLHSGGQEISKGSSVFDPTRKPKAIDFTLTAAGKGGLYLGIYELGESTRKLCFAPAGQERPAGFVSLAGSGQILVTFERVAPERASSLPRESR